jgi:hypothetical protein
MELMSAYAEDDCPKGLGTRLKTIESWISAGLLTPKETHEARRVLRLLRKRRNVRAGLH